MHSGAPARVTLHPAPAGTGRVFHTPNGEIPALLAHVAETGNRTVLARGPARVETVEHLLAACFALQLDDVAIEIDGPEAPILDGSAEPWRAAILEAGLVQHAAPAPVFAVNRVLEVREGERYARLEPGAGLELDLTIAFEEPGIGEQRFQGRLDAEMFAREIAPARTFGLAADLPRLRAAGLGLGAGLANTVAFEKGRVLNPEGLRFPNEPVRHKALDVLGDLALLGARLEGKLTASRPGHALTAALLHKLD